MEARKKERGSVTIEATVSLTVFIVCIVTVLSFINFCRVQAAVSNAVDTTAKELSQYAYFYKLSGLQKYENELNKSGKSSKDQLNDIMGAVDAIYGVIDSSKKGVADASQNVVVSAEEGDWAGIFSSLDGITGDIGAIEAEYEKLSGAIGTALDDPVAFMKSLAALAGSTALNTVKSQLIAAPLAKAMIVKHFGENKAAANEKLTKMGLVGGLDGLNFRLSTLFAPTSPEDIHIVVYYKVDIVQFFEFQFGEVLLCKEAKARAWLGGDNVTDAPKAPKDREGTEDWSIWEMSGLEYGRYITSREKEMMMSDGSAYAASGNGFDAYNNKNGANEFISVRSIDPYSETYMNNPSKIADSLFASYNDFYVGVESAPNSFTVLDKNNKTVNVDSANDSRTKKIIIVVPEGADMAIINAQIDVFKAKAEDNSLTVEVIQGYGKSPNAPK